jgi:hypothetical protein
MRPRIIVSPAEKRNVTIDRCPPLKSREFCTSLKLADSFPSAELRMRAPELRDDSKLSRRGRISLGRAAKGSSQEVSGFIERPRLPNFFIAVTRRQ